MLIKADFPEKLQFLFRSARYKVARGGRSGGKSWGFARALVIMAGNRRMRVLCVREFQRSIRDSVHKLLKDQIELLGLESQYEVLEATIKHKITGSEFIFTGLSSHTADSIKSFEAINVCWAEEGQTISKRSWDILLPTIRPRSNEEMCEIWVSYNPDLETDPTHQIFTVKQPHNCINIEINWRDNPWHSDVMEQERLRCLEQTPDDYNNIWEGKCRSAVEGAIYHKEITVAEGQNRICNVPYDPMLKVHVVLDLGWEDSLAACLVQRHISEIRIIEYVEVNHTDLDVFSNELKLRGLSWGRVWLPHDGYSGSLNSKGKSTYDILKALGWDVVEREEITELSVDEGIRNTRLGFNRLYFDKAKCHAEKAPEPLSPETNTTTLHNRIVECLKRYRRHVSKTTQVISQPVKDEHAHGADCLRYVVINAENMTNEDTSNTDYGMPNVYLRFVSRQSSGWMAA